MRYAETTTVPVERSRAEIERIVCWHAGRDAEFSSGRMAGQAEIIFVAWGRRVKFVVPLPTREESEAGARRKNAAFGSVVTSFDEEFLARIVVSDGKTIYEKIRMLAADGKRLLPALEESGKPV